MTGRRAACRKTPWPRQPAQTPKSILDTVAIAFRTLKGSVGTDDKARLDQHMTSIPRGRDQVLAVQAQVSCTVPTRPADNFSVANSNIQAWGKANMDMMVLHSGVTSACGQFLLVRHGIRRRNFSWLGHTNTHTQLAHANALKEMRTSTLFSTQLAYVMSSLDKYTSWRWVDARQHPHPWWNELGNGSAHISSPPLLLAGARW